MLIRRFILSALVATVAAFAACGGCDEGAPDGAACEKDKDCLGVCGGAGLCEGGNNGSNNTTPNSSSNSTPNNGTTTPNNGTTAPNNGTTTGLPDGSMCTSDAQCDGVCNASGVCVAGGLADGAACTDDTQCQGFCEMGTCAGGGVFVPPTNGSGQTLCGSEPCACDNGLDDDGDGLIDGADPECTGAYDNDEGTFATGIPGDNKDPKWQDCFFDGNSGAGDDHCRYHTDCLTGDLPLTDADCTVAQDCFDFCRPRTPNGCDCFGCCEVTTDAGSAFIRIGGDCSLAEIDKCDTCVQTTACLNECGECEICLGKTAADLPASCSTGGGFSGDPCVADADCQGICGGTNTCEGFGGGGDAGDGCQSDLDCRGTCGGDATCTGGGGYVGENCTDSTDCRGICGGTNTCEGYGGGGYNDDMCQTDADCRGTCGAANTCEGSGSGTGSGVQCDSGLTPCPNGQSDCPAATATTSYYCLSACCLRIDG